MDAPAGDAPAQCPACAEPVKPGDSFCEACGQNLAEPATREGCVDCGGAVSDGFCEVCGVRQPTSRDHWELELPRASGVSDKGLRHSKNEDSMAIAETADLVVAVVCDGVSSSPRPEDASKAGADTGAAVLAEQIESGATPEDAMRAAAERAAQVVAELADSAHHAPACTFVGAAVGTEAVTVGWMGDSRAYWIGDEPRRLTQDDSWATYMVEAGAMTEAEAMESPRAHMLVGWLGADAPAEPAHIATFELSGPGAVVVCSDGLWNYLPEAGELAEAAAGAPGAPMETARALTKIALDGGGHDNITVVIVPFPPRSSE